MISIIVAIGKNNVIGKGNDLPWHFKEDLKYFKETTLNKTVLMGRNTFNSILSRNNQPLPNRKNIVVTKDINFNYKNVEVIQDLVSFLEVKHDEEIFIIGGSQVYKTSLIYADRLYITHVNEEFEGDAYFPKIDFSKYELIKKRDSGVLSFCVYEKVK